MTKCPHCKKEIQFLHFCGDAYYGSYNFHEEHEMKFDCPECGETVYVLRFSIDELKEEKE